MFVVHRRNHFRLGVFFLFSPPTPRYPRIFVSNNSTGELLTNSSKFKSSPPGWPDDEPGFNARQQGWVPRFGSGRLFDGSFLANPAVKAVQESMRDLVAQASSTEPSRLEMVPERVSVKPAGCPALRPHVDGRRAATWQVQPLRCLVNVFCLGKG